MRKQTLKDIALEFLRLCASGKSREAFSTHASPRFMHHNVHFKGDAETLMAAMEENARQMPHKVFEPKHALEDGAMVAVHSHVRFQPDHPGMAVVHLFRFEEGKIVELWDLGQPVPAEMMNENGMF